VSNVVESRKDSKMEGEISSFSSRHIGPNQEEVGQMLKTLGLSNLEELVSKTIPKQIRNSSELKLDAPLSENELVSYAKKFAKKNKVFKSYIGSGFYNTLTPSVIKRNILENPCWYTQYTPYQAEISQGRLEAIINFQTLVSDLCGLDIANSSLLDEGSAAAEAITLAYRVSKKGEKVFVSNKLHKTTIEVIKTRAKPLDLELDFGNENEIDFSKEYFAVVLQYPATDGSIEDYSALASKAKLSKTKVIVGTDLLALTLLEAPGNWGADIVYGNSQRLGVPLGFGGPHAAFISCREEYKREIPGRIVGLSKDSEGNPAYRLALQTREQHIRRERATSNICTAQVLLAIMAGMYAVYHGPDGLKKIASEVNRKAICLYNKISKLGLEITNKTFFDTLSIVSLSKEQIDTIKDVSVKNSMNFRYNQDSSISISIDESTTDEDVDKIAEIFSKIAKTGESQKTISNSLIDKTVRKGKFLQQKVFNSYHTETELLRYITRLQGKDLSLAVSMIPLGSCTMKLNATTEMLPVSWEGFSSLHPYCPLDQAQGYVELANELKAMLVEITGLDDVSLQPNAGSQGEYAGLLAIRAYLDSRGEQNRNVCLIPQSAHGTNPASAAMAGMKVVVTKCDSEGNIDLEDLKAKTEEHKENLAAIMITYPSTHGVFEEAILEITETIHSAGGQVYMDGANLNAQVGLTKPGNFGIDVCHMNLHKTFCIPHGGGGPGVGPIAVASHLADFLPSDFYKESVVGPVCSAPLGSASILPIPWAYIKMMSATGLEKATQVAILNANYIAKRLEGVFDVLYKGKDGFVAHECILDFRSYKRSCGVIVADIAKRLMDYGFHAPTVSFPVIETMMVEPTESENKAELDRFCDALIQIRKEIDEVIEGKVDKDNNVLKNAPHTVSMIASDEWAFPYSRSKAVYPLAWVKERKFWPAVARVDNAYGDRNLFCSCS